MPRVPGPRGARRSTGSSVPRRNKYSLVGVNELTPEGWQSIHGGYDTSKANEDANRVLPIDVLRELENEGAIGRLLEDYWAINVATGVPESAVRTARACETDVAANAQSR